jgi:hypothetical protein
MADRETWARRVAEWKASGLSSPAFCVGKDFTPGGLRHAAHWLSHAAGGKPRVRVARVVRVGARRGAERSGAAQGGSDLVVEVGRARIAVRRGFDPATLATVLELLGAGSAR